jgi:cytoskeletal protein CcmA (bactofilin family)
VLSEGDAFAGRLEMKGDGHLMGSLEGEVDCAGELLVGPDASVNANIRAVQLTISGSVAGNVVARGRLKITATGRLRGDADAASLVVQEGGVHFGVLRVHPDGVPEADAAAAGQDAEPTPSGEEASVPEASRSTSRPLAGPVDRVRRLLGELF